jgi:hypothetical protein
MYEAAKDDTVEDAKVDWHQMQKKKAKEIEVLDEKVLETHKGVYK